MAGLFDERSGGLVTYWKGKTGITDLVGTTTSARIYPGFAKHGASLPHITYVRVGGDAADNLAGVTGTRHTVLHVYCYASTASGADALAEAVRANTANYRGDMSGVYVNWVECTDAIDDGIDEVTDGSDAQRYWARVILRISHAEAAGV